MEKKNQYKLIWLQNCNLHPIRITASTPGLKTVVIKKVQKFNHFTNNHPSFKVILD